MSEELLPCPFCGGEAEITLDSGRNVIGVGCKKCVCSMTPSWGDHDGKRWAAHAWNTRPALIDHLEADGGVEAMREACANTAYRICAEDRHVTLGDKVRAALSALPVLGVGRSQC